MNVRPVEPPNPADETCTVARQLYGALVVPNQEGRLIDPLRHAAQIRKIVTGVPTGGGDAVAILTLAAIERVRTQLDDTPPNPMLATALADLAVTGRLAYDDFCSVEPQDTLIQQAVKLQFAGDPRANAILIAECVAEVLDRAYSVAWFLSGQSARGDLGWIAVSSEDDAPYRPVNAARSRFPQCDLLFTVPGAKGNVVVMSRFVIATANEPVDPPVVTPQRSCPPVMEPVLPPNDQIILYIHGSDSQLEEAEALIPHLVRTPDGLPTGFSVISMDLPGSGYVNLIDHTEVADFLPPASDLSLVLILWLRSNLALMPFLEEFIVAFVSALSSRLGQPGLVEGRLAAVMGGSLGGNLALRLAQRHEPWLRNAVAYSPGSVWDALGDVILQQGVVSRFLTCLEGENDQSRGDFFSKVFDQAIPLKTQPDQWYRDDWPCKLGYISNARLDRRETYTSQSRRWHWRISIEELAWTWRDPVLEQGFRHRVLLGAGKADDYWPAKIFSNTFDLAGEMVTPTDGDTFFFDLTGHSIHAERPAALAGKVLAFLPNPLASNARFVRLIGPITLAPGQTGSMQVVMQNVGGTTWTAAGANPFRLGSQNPQDNATWGFARQDVKGSIAPGAEATFTLNITAPTAPGTYNFQWRMVQEMVTWFGDFTANIEIVVGHPVPKTMVVSVQPYPVPAGKPVRLTVSAVDSVTNVSLTPPGNVLFDGAQVGSTGLAFPTTIPRVYDPDTGTWTTVPPDGTVTATGYETGHIDFGD